MPLSIKDTIFGKEDFEIKTYNKTHCPFYYVCTMFQETLGIRIKRKREEIGLSQEELGRKLGKVTHASISNWESNKTVPASKNLTELAKIFNCSIEWLLSGKSHVDFQDISKIPILDNLDITNSLNISSENKKYIISDRTDISDNAFGYVVQNNAMFPVFLLGDVVIIDPERHPETECFVLAKVSDSILIRRFIVDEVIDGKEQFSLVPLNTDYSTLSTADKKIDILGTVVEHRSNRER